ncbi:hypothetical protein ACTFQ5_15780 [Aliivibrio fischeri]|uniref:hypothetical protein n=1 Tax=Aliivibrio fischeri TaxID=668 RepID=UPI0007C5747C|nr:hypothetical protein [Aliivibrio fischeri]MBP3140110.1 hypothetical protein [Aliivibrio fischeri]
MKFFQGLLVIGSILALLACSKTPEIKSINQIDNKSLQICFNEPFKKGTLYSLEFTDYDGKILNRNAYANKFKPMYQSTSNGLCYSTTIGDYFDSGRSTPKDLATWKMTLTPFDKVSIKIALPKGSTTLTKNQPDKIFYTSEILLNTF